MTAMVHEASIDEDTGRVLFKFQVGDNVLVGQVPTEGEYKALLTMFCGWRDEKGTFPAPVPFEVPA